MSIVHKPSPNHGARPAGTDISLVVLHADASNSELSTISWLLNPQSGVSYHYLIARTGQVYQFVEDHRRAWHAGPSTFGGVNDCNNYSLGVSFSNNQKGEAFPEDQLASGVQLVADLCRRHAIPVARITTHAEIAVPKGRKVDPGPKFPMTDFLVRVAAALT